MDKDKLKDRHYYCSQCGNQIVVLRKGAGQLICCGRPLKRGQAAETGTYGKDEAPAKTPFLTKAVLCPACGWTTQNREIKSKLYIVKAKEADMHATEFAWRDPEFKDIYPPYYVFFSCERCGYTDFIAEFRSKDNKNFLNYNHFMDMIFHYRQIPGSVMNKLLDRVNLENINFEVSVCMHLLALHIQTLVNKSHIHREKIARLYLRTAWLLRDRDKLADTSEINHALAFMSELNGQDPRIPTSERECMKQAISFYMQAVDNDSRFDDPVLLSNTIFFIADLLSISGSFDEAIDMVTALAKEDTDARRTLSERLAKNKHTATAAEKEDGEGNKTETKTLNRKVRQLSQAMEKIRDKITEIRHLKLNSKRAQILTVLAKLPDASKDKLVEVFATIGITEKDVNLIDIPQVRKEKHSTRSWEYWKPLN